MTTAPACESCAALRVEIARRLARWVDAFTAVVVPAVWGVPRDETAAPVTETSNINSGESKK